jgi:large subunit ribosomal protein L14
MLQLKSVAVATDKTSVVLVQCLKVLKSFKRRIALIGDLIIICVHSINSKKYLSMKGRLQKRFRVGSIHRALILRSKTNFRRTPGILLKFNQNQVVLVTRQVVPVSNRVYGPVLREFCMK